MADAALEELRAAAAEFLPAYLHDLEQLVNIDCGSYTKAGVDKVGAWVEQRLGDLGASVVRYADAELGDTLVGTLEGARAGPSVVVVAHLDTVFEPGTVAQRPFTIDAGRALGPGVSDMKAGLLSGLYALATLRRAVTARATDAAASGSASVADWLPVGRLIFIVNSDEEIGSPSSESIIREQAAGTAAALVLEAARANGDIVSSRKGHTVLHMHLRGRAAHAGVDPERGRSAILEAAHKIVALHALNGRFPGASVYPEVIHGGTRPNIVPDRATIEIDVRAVRRSDLVSVEAAIGEIAASSTVPDVSSTVELDSRYWPMERSTASQRLLEHAVEVAAGLGFSLGDAATGGASDANTTAGLGVPTIDGLGPIGGLDHGPGEYVEIDSIVPRMTLLAGILRAIGRDALVRGDESLTSSGDQPQGERSRA